MSGYPEAGNVSIQVRTCDEVSGDLLRYEEQVMEADLDQILSIQKVLATTTGWQRADCELEFWRTGEGSVVPSLEVQVQIVRSGVLELDDVSDLIECLRVRFSALLAGDPPWCFSPCSEIVALGYEKADATLVALIWQEGSNGAAHIRVADQDFMVTQEHGYVRITPI